MNIRFDGAEVADCDSKGDAVIELGVGEENVTRGVDVLKELHVEVIEGFTLQTLRSGAKAHHRERAGRHTFEIGFGVDPIGKIAGHGDVTIVTFANPVETKAA